MEGFRDSLLSKGFFPKDEMRRDKLHHSPTVKRRRDEQLGVDVRGGGQVDAGHLSQDFQHVSSSRTDLIFPRGRLATRLLPTGHVAKTLTRPSHPHKRVPPGSGVDAGTEGRGREAHVTSDDAPAASLRGQAAPASST